MPPRKKGPTKEAEVRARGRVVLGKRVAGLQRRSRASQAIILAVCPLDWRGRAPPHLVPAAAACRRRLPPAAAACRPPPPLLVPQPSRLPQASGAAAARKAVYEAYNAYRNKPSNEWLEALVALLADGRHGPAACMAVCKVPHASPPARPPARPPACCYICLASCSPP